MGVIFVFSKYPDVVTVKDLCEMLSIGRNNAYRLLQSGSIKYVKVGKVYKIPKKFVIDFIRKS